MAFDNLVGLQSINSGPTGPRDSIFETKKLENRNEVENIFEIDVGSKKLLPMQIFRNV